MPPETIDMPDIDRILRWAEDCLEANPPDLEGADRYAMHIRSELSQGGRLRPGEAGRFQSVIRRIREAHILERPDVIAGDAPTVTQP